MRPEGRTCYEPAPGRNENCRLPSEPFRLEAYAGDGGDGGGRIVRSDGSTLLQMLYCRTSSYCSSHTGCVYAPFVAASHTSKRTQFRPARFGCSFSVLVPKAAVS